MVLPCPWSQFSCTWTVAVYLLVSYNFMKKKSKPYPYPKTVKLPDGAYSKPQIFKNLPEKQEKEPNLEEVEEDINEEQLS